MPLHVVENDLLRMDVDAVVNPANSRLAAGGGVCGAIFDAAGYRELQAACDAIGGCEPGKAVITPGFKLKQPYVIHTVGPIWHGGNAGEEQILSNAYRSSLALAEEKGLKSVAFPLISAGIFGYPKDEAFRVALDTVRAFLMEKDERELDVSIVLLDRKAVSLGHKLFGEIKSYLKENGFDEEPWLNSRRKREAAILMEQSLLQKQTVDTGMPCIGYGGFYQGFGEKTPMPEAVAAPAGEYELGESFSKCLLRMIDERQLRDPEVYKAANVDRKLFSKIRSNADYQPKKTTALALAVGMGLNVEDTQALLETAGYTLSRSNMADAIVRGCLEKGVHDIFEINELLFRYDQPPLA